MFAMLSIYGWLTPPCTPGLADESGAYLTSRSDRWAWHHAEFQGYRLD